MPSPRLMRNVLCGAVLAACLLFVGAAGAQEDPEPPPARPKWVRMNGRLVSVTDASGPSEPVFLPDVLGPNVFLPPRLPTSQPASSDDEDEGDDSPTPRAGPPTSATSADSEEGALPKVEGMDEDTVRALVRMAKGNSDHRAAVLRMYPQLAEALGEKPAAPESRPAVSTTQLAAGEDKRQKADALVARLAGASPKELEAVEEELFQLGRDAMVPLKLGELSDNFELRQRSAAAAARLRWRLACGEALLKKQPGLIAAMSGADAAVRAAAMDKVVQSAGAEAVDFLGECLADPQPFVRQRAIDGLVLAHQGGQSVSDKITGAQRKAVRFLESALADDEDRNIRLLAIGALAKIRSINVDQLSRLLEDDSLEVRATVIRAMGFSGEAKAIPVIKPLLKDPQWQVRAAALEALGELVNSDKARPSAPDVLERLRDEDAYVRDLAAKILGRWRYTDSAATILRLVREGRVSEGAGFVALAQMKDRAGRATLFQKYAEANDVSRRVEVLTFLSEYDPDAEVDRALEEAIRSEALKAGRARFITLSSRRDNRKRFFALVCPYVESDDEAVAEAASQMVEEGAYNQPMPSEQVNRLLEGNHVRRATTALRAAYRYNAADFNSVLRKAAAHPLPDVASQALGMIGSIYLSDSLGEGIPSYRRNESYHSPSDPPVPRQRLPADMAKEVARNFSRGDSRYVPLFAAAILYRSGADQSEPVVRALQAGLKDPEVSLRYKAMAGIVEKPQPFLAGFDLIAASRDRELVGRAIDIMAGLQDPNYVPRLMELAADADLESVKLMRALIMSGDPNAMALVLSKSAESEGYTRRQLAEGLTGSPGPGPVQFVSHLLKTEKEDYEREQLAGVLVSLPDPSVKPVLQALLEDKKLAARGGRMNSRLLARLTELDPAGGAERLRKLLASGDRDTLESALDSLAQTKPNKDLVAIVLEAATKEARPESQVDAWYRLIEWVPGDDLRGQFLPALSNLNPTAQDALLRRVSRDLDERDLAPLMGASVKNAFTKMWLSSLIGQLTADAPQRRPALDKLSAASSASLPGVLLAAGDWEDAPAVLAPFLGDSRPEAASAACAGLSLYLLGHPRATLTDAQRQALVRGIQGAEAIPAYLAAEALGLCDGNALLRVEPNSIPTSTAALRLAVAHGRDLPPALQDLVRSALSGSAGPTAIQLAALAAAAGWQDTYSVRLDDLVGRVPSDLLLRLAVASKKTDLLGRVWVDNGETRLWRQVPPEMRRSLVDKARKSDPRLFSWLAAGGWVEKPEEGDLVRLLRTAGTSSGGYDSSSSTVPDWPLTWGAVPEDPEVIKLISADKALGLTAAALAAVQWDSNVAHEALLKAATTVPKKGSSSRQGLQMIAVKALRLCGRPEDANALAEAWKKFDPEDYQQRELQKEMLALILRLSPQTVARLATSQAGNIRDDYETGPVLNAAAILTADGNGLEIELSDWNRGDTRLDALRQLKSAVAPQGTTAPAALTDPAAVRPGTIVVTVPGTAAATQPAAEDPVSSQWMALAAPPWGEAARYGFGSDTAMFSDPKALALDVLDQFVAQARDLQRNADKQAARNALSRYGGVSSYSSSDSQDNSTAGRLAREALQRFSSAAAPEEAYSSTGDVFPVGLYHVPGDRMAKELTSLLAHESRLTRTVAMRAAAAWRVTEVADAVAARLDGNAAEAVEAAWALASLNGRAALGPIAQAHQRQKDFDTRVRLACLLRMLGDDRGRADIDRALSLGTTRLFRMKFLQQQVSRDSYSSSSYRRTYGGDMSPDFYSAPQFSVRDRLLPWMAALQLAAPDLLRDAMKPFPLPPAEPEEADAEEEPAAKTGIDLSSLRLNAQGLLVVYPPRGTSLPLMELAGGEGLSRTYSPDLSYTYRRYGYGGDNRYSLEFASLPADEQSLEPMCFVQFADQSAGPTDLAARWRAWWTANKDKPRANWWRQAAAQATAELTHPKWWYRMLAARRLMRLTGRPVAVPNPFDRPAWAALQGQWRQWLAQHGKDDPRAWLIAAAVEAKVLEAAPQGRPSTATPGAEYAATDAAWLDALVRMAGSGRHPLSSAALLQLASWPDREQLVRHCLPWQESRVESLRSWARKELQRLSGRRLLVFTDVDLPARAATQPARGA